MYREAIDKVLKLAANGLKKEEVLALDISTKCGYCVGNTHGMQQFKDQIEQDRLPIFEEWLSKLLKEHQIKVVCAERVFIPRWGYKHESQEQFDQRLYACEALLKLHGVAENVCAKAGIPFVGITPAHIKKFITGNGQASKKDVMNAIKERYGITCKTDDEADAISLWHYFIAYYHINGQSYTEEWGEIIRKLQKTSFISRKSNKQ